MGELHEVGGMQRGIVPMNMYSTELRNLSDELERRQTLEMLLAQLDGMVYRCHIDEHWTMDFVSDGCLPLTGYQPQDLLHNRRLSWEELTYPADRQLVRHEVAAALTQQRAFSIEYRILAADGSIKWVWERGTALHAGTGNPMMVHGFIQDITRRVLHEKALREAEQRYRSIFENANEGIFQTTPDGQYIEVNPALAAIYGYDSPQDLIAAFDNIATQLYVDPRRRREFTELLRRNQSVINFESQVYRKDRSIIWISENAHVVHDAEGEVLYYEGTVADITARKTYEQRISWQATHDVLTGLPNRALLAERIEQAIAQAGTRQRCFAVVFIDLDNFKAVNDTMGHACGDQLIKQVARRLTRCLRDTDTVARIGGDEFVLLLEDVEHDYDALSQLLERTLTAIREPCQLGEREFTVCCSVGVSLFPSDGADADTLLKHADIAMYQAKESGRNNFQFFTEEFNRIVVENHELLHELQQAIATGDFELYYQPIVAAATGTPVKAEALLRWRRRDGRFVPPSRFIPLAESNGLIEALGAWVLDTVCATLADWKARGLPLLPVSINISPRQFNQSDLVPAIAAALQRHALEPALLEIEITETCLARDKGTYLRTLGEMKALGLSIVIDDFGSGYSNMGSLKTMLFSALKIDRSFISLVEQDPDHRAIYRAMISMAHTLNLQVVAEGVETRRQLEFLREAGCNLIQGFYFDRPMPQADFEAGLAALTRP